MCTQKNVWKTGGLWRIMEATHIVLVRILVKWPCQAAKTNTPPSPGLGYKHRPKTTKIKPNGAGKYVRAIKRQQWVIKVAPYPYALFLFLFLTSGSNGQP